MSMTSQLCDIVENHPKCYFVATASLDDCRGNNINSDKLNRLSGPLDADNERSLPILVVNPICKQVVLIEGNHRHEYFSRNDWPWFPVYIRLEHYVSPIGDKGLIVSDIDDEQEAFDQFDAVDVLQRMFGIRVKK